MTRYSREISSPNIAACWKSLDGSRQRHDIGSNTTAGCLMFSERRNGQMISGSDWRSVGTKDLAVYQCWPAADQDRGRDGVARPALPSQWRRTMLPRQGDIR